MTTSDGNPLTGDVQAPDVRHLVELVKGAIARPAEAARALRVPVPVIHEPCGLTQCAGCTATACVSRRPRPVPVTITRHTPWYDTDTIDGNTC